MSAESRRRFLQRLGQAAIVAAADRCLAGPPRAESQAALPAPPPATTAPSHGPVPEAAKSVVVDARNPMVLAEPQIHEAALSDLLDNALRLVTNESSAEQAWRSLLKPQDVIGLKFDEAGSEKINTTSVLADRLVRSLERAGFPRQRIVLIDVPGELAVRLETQPRVFGWREEQTSFGSGREQLARVLDQVTALVNVPFLKTDNISGIGGALRNVSLPFVRRQSRYFDHGGTPFIPDIVALPQIRSRLRIHIVNGLRGVFDRGPDVHPACVWPHAGILVSTDPVAVDAVALDLINARRAEAKLPLIGDARGRLAHLQEAARKGLGTDDQDYIRLLTAYQS